MKKSLRRQSFTAFAAGFTLIELAVGMLLIGIALSGALMFSGKLWEGERHESNREELQKTKAALLAFARKNGRFPMMDGVNSRFDSFPLTDGLEEVYGDTYSQIFGWVPYKTIGSSAGDAYGQPVQYFVNWQLAKEGKACNTLNNYFQGKIFGVLNIYGYRYQSMWDYPNTHVYFERVCWYPQLWINGTFPVAAVLVSSGEDKDFNYPHKDAYNIGPYFVQRDQTSTIGKADYFDDDVVYITLPEAYAALNCQ